MATLTDICSGILICEFRIFIEKFIFLWVDKTQSTSNNDGDDDSTYSENIPNNEYKKETTKRKRNLEN